MRRLPLLTSAIVSRLCSESSELAAATESLQLLNALVEKCNESARRVQRSEELIALSKQLDFR
jgi:neuronal guanine nucleotide exchange factor